MSSAGRAVNLSGFATTLKERELGLSGFAAQIRLSSSTGSYVMETAEHREPCESRGSRTDLGAPGGEIPPGDSTVFENQQPKRLVAESAASKEALVQLGRIPSARVRPLAMDVDDAVRAEIRKSLITAGLLKPIASVA